jgi:hypothetical protein
MHKSKNGEIVVACRITADVIDHVGDTFVILWRMSDLELASGVPEATAKRVAALLSQHQSPVLEVQVREGVGVVGLRNWEVAAAESIALADNAMKLYVKGDAEATRKAIDFVKGMVSTRDGAENMLLKHVRPYFLGAYCEVSPGMTVTDDAQLPLPIGKTLELPAKRTVSFEAIDPAKPRERRLAIDYTIDRVAAKVVFESMIKEMVATLAKDKQPPSLDDYDVTMSLRWTLEAERGWPSDVKYSVMQKANGRAVGEDYTWTLLEGPMAIPTERPAAGTNDMFDAAER